MRIRFTLPTALFAVVQLTGLVCMFTWQLPQVYAYWQFMWVTASLALLPGNILSALLIEKLMWGSGLSLMMIAMIELSVTIAINAAVWLGVIRALRGLAKLMNGRLAK